MFFLALISLERAFAKFWPLLHRTTSTKTFTYSVFAAWLADVPLGSLTWLFEFSHCTLTFSIAIFLSLAAICKSYIATRKKTSTQWPHNRNLISPTSGWAKHKETFQNVCPVWREHLLPFGLLLGLFPYPRNVPSRIFFLWNMPLP